MGTHGHSNPRVSHGRGDPRHPQTKWPQQYRRNTRYLLSHSHGEDDSSRGAPLDATNRGWGLICRQGWSGGGLGQLEDGEEVPVAEMLGVAQSRRAGLGTTGSWLRIQPQERLGPMTPRPELVADMAARRPRRSARGVPVMEEIDGRLVAGRDASQAQLQPPSGGSVDAPEVEAIEEAPAATVPASMEKDAVGECCSVHVAGYHTLPNEVVRDSSRTLVVGAMRNEGDLFNPFPLGASGHDRGHLTECLEAFRRWFDEGTTAAVDISQGTAGPGAKAASPQVDRQ